MRGFAELLQMRGTYLPRLVEGIIVQTKRMDRLIRNMLDLSLVESGRLQLQRESVDLVVLARHAVDQTQLLTRSHTVRLDAPAAPLIGDWDAGRLDQILQNLLSNAVKYAPDGGEIVVEVKDASGTASIAVTDQGVGIAAGALPRLFDRFYRSREAAASSAGGLGLGLAITRMLVEAHGGQISAESRLGEGSTFRVILPYKSKEPTSGEDAWSA
jgi:signal transduction histidine kinase